MGRTYNFEERRIHKKTNKSKNFRKHRQNKRRVHEEDSTEDLNEIILDKDQLGQTWTTSNTT